MSELEQWKTFNSLEKLDSIRNLVFVARKEVDPSVPDEFIKKILGLNMNFDKEFMYMLDAELCIQKRKAA